MERLQVNRISHDERVIEAYKTLRTNIHFCGFDVKVIAVTSCEPNEGKSTVSFNLARTLAESDKKVILIDSDLRESVSNEIFIDDNKQGLSNYLSGQCKLGKVLFSTDIKNLFTVLSGPVPPNPAELLNRIQFDNMIKVSRELFDYVIIDTAPLGRVIDCAAISKHCDGIVLVIESGYISLKYAKAVKKQIEKTGCPLLGVTLNKFDMSGKEHHSQ